MHARVRMLGLLAACLFFQGAAAQPSSALLDVQGADAPAAVGAAAACAPPCGYITPAIDLEFPDNVKCGGALGLGAASKPCQPLPAAGESVVYAGTFRWYWEVSNDGTLPNDPQTDIQVTFSGVGSNPGFLEATVEPEGFTITTADLFMPDNFKTETEDPTRPRVWFWFERPVNVTITRTGDPTPDEADLLAQKGTVDFFLKAKSTESSDRIRAAFGMESFRYDAATVAASGTDTSESVPALPVLAGLGAVAAVAVVLRRRR